MISRRGFLGTIAGTLAAPAIVRAESLMKIVVPKKDIYIPDLNLTAGSFNRGSPTALGGDVSKFQARSFVTVVPVLRDGVLQNEIVGQLLGGSSVSIPVTAETLASDKDLRKLIAHVTTYYRQSGKIMQI